MNRIQKFLFFLLSLTVMATLATGAIFIGQAKFSMSIIAFAIAIVLIGFGFMMRKRIMRME
ncbi:DUF5325 family protein [Fodinisporobacter ferrooxydans]|uniref:DUF5325 family protein n=1 Tax=Fodinisporobacter ferrooxydans TaxID=2901836 RepID=A0ABY4CNR3_9BACL|nr:DUF5325 family protein [Alicyclobacillaceae bacterium MYW30-H2]